MKVGDTFTYDSKRIDGDGNVSYVSRTGHVEAIDGDGTMKVRVDGLITTTYFTDDQLTSTTSDPIWLSGKEADFLNATII